MRSKVITTKSKRRQMHLQEGDREEMELPLGVRRNLPAQTHNCTQHKNHFPSDTKLPHRLAEEPAPRLIKLHPKTASLLAVSCPLLHYSQSPPALVDSQFLWGGSRAMVCPATALWLGNCAAAPLAVLLYLLLRAVGNCAT